jgi:hypothetical protein
MIDNKKDYAAVRIFPPTIPVLIILAGIGMNFVSYGLPLEMRGDKSGEKVERPAERVVAVSAGKPVADREKSDRTEKALAGAEKGK